LTAAELIRALMRGGWQLRRQTGGHARYTHPDRPGRRATVPRHAGQTIPLRTLKHILDGTGRSPDELRDLL